MAFFPLSSESNKNERSDATYAPPPPTEVSIRTLESDIKSMALSGGGFPAAQRVALPQRVEPKGGKAGGVFASGYIFRIIWALTLVLVLGAIFYFVFPLFSSSSPDKLEVLVPTSTLNPVLPSVPPGMTTLKFNHQSYFRKPAEAVLTLRLSYPARTAENSANYNQKLSALLESEPATSTFYEVRVEKDNGEPLAFSQFLEAAGIKLLDSDFLASNFNPDFTFFIYQTKKGFWPGLLAQAQSEKNWILLKPEIVKLENSEVETFFLGNPGRRIGFFEDSLISRQSARILKFESPEASFVYGWFHDYLVMSTSLEGLKEAVNRL